MADIISGKSRFNGDKNAPVKKIITIILIMYVKVSLKKIILTLMQPN